MSRSNTLARDFWSNLFEFGGRDWESEQLEEELETHDEQSLEARRDGKLFKKPSLYVRVFEDMINAIMEKETHLLSDAEWDVLKVVRNLDYSARYLLVRLVLRQPEWHALSSLHKYSSEIGEEGLEEALNILCVPVEDLKLKQLSIPSPDPIKEEIIKEDTVEKEGEDVIDMTSLNGVSLEPVPCLPPTQKQTQAILTKPSTKTSKHEIEEPIVDPANLNFEFMFRDQSSMTVREALTRLTLPDLREISRSMKVGTLTMRKDVLINAMVDHAIGQHTLPTLAKRMEKGKGKQAPKYDGLVQTQLSFGQKPKVISQLKRLRDMALARLGPCVKINPNLYWFVGRLHLIAYRGTEKPNKYCLPALLAGFKKWNFPEYIYQRDGSIWPTREDFLEYEEALYLDAEMENPPEDVSRAPGVSPRAGSKAPTTPSKNRFIPSKTPQTKETPTLGQKVEENELASPAPGVVEVNEDAKQPVSIQRARYAKKLFVERIQPKWRELVVRKDKEKGKAAVRTPGIERFEAGYVYTKMVYKAARAFGTLKEWSTELAILEKLLEQTHWRKGKRAAWYDRRAIVLGQYIKPDHEILRDCILQALADEYTGIVNRPGLARRLERVQKKMKLHPEKRIVCEGVLKSTTEISITAKRSDLHPGVKLDQNLRPMKGSVPLLVSDFFPVKSLGEEPEKEPEKDTTNGTIVIQLTAPEPTPKRKGKSSWVGFSDEVVNVETYALQYYEMHGYVGWFHSETRVLTTIFALVFWDIIFSPIPGAFETQFQAGPLDMFEDSFYLARRALFESRLREIREGKAQDYLKRHDDRHRPKRTWCIGLKWDVCEQKQLVEILECLGTETLAMICRLFCEDYTGRASGVPDLIVWNAKEGICKFVEVKGPGDNLQPNQKLWVDSLLRAGAHVEICRVVDQDAPEPKKRKRTTPTSKQRKRQKGKDETSLNDREQQLDSDDDDGDYLPQPPLKRRKVEMDDLERVLATPKSIT
ncbi:hypothetical protein P691DRAFT_705955 [Macrolepiota fuliginosa MF-IS2]|uniref:Fanconi-associated nuclease n=1 Tax=Macrolepiota fuliginosa MF-IS2 TaxID=1400762 RepID=A0A9P5XAQ4_9AGAR|nr:hypothetical protein P691DRAFT_705955 [Macrolepiota fuliginosa MF-IS2]